MRIAVVSDIHGNLTALEAVLADLREISPDLVTLIIGVGLLLLSSLVTRRHR